jgi:hypothetical protein
MTDPLRLTFDDERRLAVCRPHGRLDADLAARLLTFLLALEAAEPDPFDRLLDLTAVERIRLTADEMYHIARTRRAATVGRRPFRTAILAPTILTYGIGRMYEVLMEGSAVEVGVFRDAGGAATWLGVSRSVVDPPAAT